MPAYLTQVQLEPTGPLSLDWEKIDAGDRGEAAVKTLKKDFARLRPLSFVWVAVADDKSPYKHDNGMPMIIHSFKLQWQKEGGKPCPAS